MNCVYPADRGRYFPALKSEREQRRCTPLFVKKSPLVRDKKYQGVSLNFLIDTFSMDKEAEHTRTEAMEVETRLKQFYFEKYLLDVASATLERGGVTTNVDTYEFLAPIDAWGVPKYPGKTVVLRPGANLVEELRWFIRENNRELNEPGAWLGTWVHPSTHCCYLDITAIASCLEAAKQEAFKRSQQDGREIVALYNFKYQQTVYLCEPAVVTLQK